MEDSTLITVQEKEGIFYHAPSALVNKDFVQIDKVHTTIGMIEGVSVRRRRGLYFGWAAFWAFVLFIYGVVKSQLLNFQQQNPWHFSFNLLSQPWDWVFIFIGLLAFIPALRFTLFPPFALYLEVSEGGNEKEILVRTSLQAAELEKMAAAIEKAMDWDYAPMKTF